MPDSESAQLIGKAKNFCLIADAKQFADLPRLGALFAFQQQRSLGVWPLGVSLICLSSTGKSFSLESSQSRDSRLLSEILSCQTTAYPPHTSRRPCVNCDFLYVMEPALAYTPGVLHANPRTWRKRSRTSCC